MRDFPAELLSEIFHQAAIRSTTDKDEHPYVTSTLSALCLTSKEFYPHAARLLYSNVIIRSFSNRLPLPFNPAFVRTLVILNDRVPTQRYHRQRNYKAAALDRWRQLEDAAAGMVNLERLVYESDYRSPRLAAAFSKLPALKHLTCGNTDDLGPLPPLSSLTVYWLPYQSATQLQTLPALLYTSRSTLQTLRISTNLLDNDEARRVLTTVFAPPCRLRLKELSLEMISRPDIATVLTQAIDFTVLETLVVIDYSATDLFLALRNIPLTLRKLCLVGPAEGVLESFTSLSELEWKEQGSPGLLDIRIITRHTSLRRLNLESHSLSTAACEQLVKACKNLERLMMTVKATDLRAFATSLATLHDLDQLNIQFQCDAPRLPTTSKALKFACPPFIHADHVGLATMYPFLPSLHDELDAGLYILLQCGVRCRDIQISGVVDPYWNDFETAFFPGGIDGRIKRWVSEGMAWEGQDITLGRAWRGGNVGDCYQFGEERLVQVGMREEREIVPLGKLRVPACCRRRPKRCRAREG